MRIDDTPGKEQTGSMTLGRGNESTRVFSITGLVPRRIDPFRQAWLQNYAELRRAFAAAPAPSYVLVAALPASSRLVQLALPLSSSECVDVIIGRHERCDFFLREDPRVALRHVLARAYLTQDGQPRFRLLDLHSKSQFRDETGKPCAGLMSEGHLFVSIGQYDVMAFLKLGNEPLPIDAAEAWDRLPERRILEVNEPASGVYKPIQVRPALQLVDGAAARENRDEITITRLRGPSPLQELSEPPEARPGGATLVFSEAGQSRWAQLLETDLESGVLLGRYERCQLRTKNLRPEEADDLSRIHLCLLKDETGYWAIDTASTNGTTCNGEPIRSAKLGKSATLTLAGKLTVRWKLAPDGGDPG